MATAKNTKAAKSVLDTKAARAKARETMKAANKLAKAQAAHETRLDKAATADIGGIVANFIKAEKAGEFSRAVFTRAMSALYPGWYLLNLKAANLKANPNDVTLHTVAAHRDAIVKGLAQPHKANPLAYGGSVWNKLQGIAASQAEADAAKAVFVAADTAKAEAAEAAQAVEAAKAQGDAEAVKAARAAKAEADAKAATAKAEADKAAADPMADPVKVRDATADALIAAWRRLNRSPAYRAENGVETLARLNDALQAAMVAAGLNVDEQIKAANFVA